MDVFAYAALKSLAHYDDTEIRGLIEELDNKLNAIADSTDVDLDQLSEIVEFIKNNRDFLENKVNVKDIINDLTSEDIDKPLAANQGKVLNDLISALSSSTEENLANLNDLIGALSEEVNENIGSSINELSAKLVEEVNNLNTSIDTLSESTNESIGDLNQSISNLATTVSENTSSLQAEINSKVDANWVESYIE